MSAPDYPNMFSQSQYDMLIRCSKKRDISEWNNWRKTNPNVPVQLHGADFTGVYLEGVEFTLAHLTDARFTDANLNNADFNYAQLQAADFVNARLNHATFYRALLQQANFTRAQLPSVLFRRAQLSAAQFHNANLHAAKFRYANLNEADFTAAYLDTADFTNTTVNGETIITHCSIDEATDFRNVGLDSLRIDAGIKEALKYNRRKMNWQDWFKKHPGWTVWPMKAFWAISDYGQSMTRIIFYFFLFSFVFSLIYCLAGLIAPPGVINNLFLDPQGQPIYPWVIPFRAFYFSVVTMTTLGFGDMHALAQDKFCVGHILLTLQVIIGYVLLGAVITRLGIMFTADSPIARRGTMPEWIRTAINERDQYYQQNQPPNLTPTQSTIPDD
ncbi:MAG: pentapeptide repeat-containing protein [Sedimentisphaerales bacterium]|nr:pentapeptide repeat-containing protein [Sedimentisphaerales bacterium]